MKLVRTVMSISVILLVLIAIPLQSGLNRSSSAHYLSDQDSIASRQSILNITHPAVFRTVYGYYPYWIGTTAYTSFQWDLLTHISWFDVTVNGNGSVTNSNGWPNTNLISTAHSHGVKVDLCAAQMTLSTINSIIASDANRTNAANNLLKLVQNGNGDGVNIDFEGFGATNSVTGGSNKQLFLQFIQTLNTTFKATNSSLEVSIAAPAVDWNNCWDYNALAKSCDGLMIMCYDFFYGGSKTTGPVSPLTGYTYDDTNTINTYITKTGNNTAKLIMGLPYYGYDWPTLASTAGATTNGTGTAVLYKNAAVNAAKYGRNWDNNSKTPWYAYYTTTWHQCWYDDNQSLRLKYDFVNSKNLQGIGIWALGYDGTMIDLWDAIRAKFVLPSVSVLSPAGGEHWTVGSIQDLKWNATGGDGALKIRLEYSTTGSGGSWKLIADNQSNNGTYKWIIPSTPSTDCYIKVTATDSANPSKSGANSVFNKFNIDNPVPEDSSIILLTIIGLVAIYRLRRNKSR